LESGERVIVSPLHGKILSLSVREGEIVEMGSTLLVIEAMKMENLISSPQRAKIGKVLVSESEQVSDGAELIVLEKI
jgi:biotin carboxyl carrier protein